MPQESKKNKQLRAARILNTLIHHHPRLGTFLTHNNTFELLIAVILSAQCTDERVNLTTPALFNKYKSPKQLGNAQQQDVETLIQSINYYKTKSKNIIQTSNDLVQRFNGHVPNTLEQLITLPGVGRKTANVILGQAFNKPGITVDTHVKRVSTRLGFTRATDATKIEFELQQAWPTNTWTDLSTHLIYHGRQICKPRKPNCDICTLLNDCPRTTI